MGSTSSGNIDDSLRTVEERFRNFCQNLLTKKYSNGSVRKNLFTDDQDALPKKKFLRPSMIDRACLKTAIVSSTPMVDTKKRLFTPESSGIISSINETGKKSKKSAKKKKTPPKLRFSERTTNSVTTLSSLDTLGDSQIISPTEKEGPSNSVRDDGQIRNKKKDNIERLTAKLKSSDHQNKKNDISNKSIQTSKTNSQNKVGPIVHTKKSARSIRLQTGDSLFKNFLAGPSESSSSISLNISNASDTSLFCRSCDNLTLGKNLFSDTISSSFSDKGEKRKITPVDSGVPWRLPSGLVNPVVSRANSLIPLNCSLEESLDDTFRPKLPRKKKVFTNKKKSNSSRRQTTKQKSRRSVNITKKTITDDNNSKKDDGKNILKSSSNQSTKKKTVDTLNNPRHVVDLNDPNNENVTQSDTLITDGGGLESEDKQNKSVKTSGKVTRESKKRGRRRKNNSSSEVCDTINLENVSVVLNRTNVHTLDTDHNQSQKTKNNGMIKPPIDSSAVLQHVETNRPYTRSRRRSSRRHNDTNSELNRPEVETVMTTSKKKKKPQKNVNQSLTDTEHSTGVETRKGKNNARKEIMETKQSTTKNKILNDNLNQEATDTDFDSHSKRKITLRTKSPAKESGNINRIDNLESSNQPLEIEQSEHIETRTSLRSEEQTEPNENTNAGVTEKLTNSQGIVEEQDNFCDISITNDHTTIPKEQESRKITEKRPIKNSRLLSNISNVHQDIPSQENNVTTKRTRKSKESSPPNRKNKSDKNVSSTKPSQQQSQDKFSQKLQHKKNRGKPQDTSKKRLTSEESGASSVMGLRRSTRQRRKAEIRTVGVLLCNSQRLFDQFHNKSVQFVVQDTNMKPKKKSSKKLATTKRGTRPYSKQTSSVNILPPLQETTADVHNTDTNSELPELCINPEILDRDHNTITTTLNTDNLESATTSDTDTLRIIPKKSKGKSLLSGKILKKQDKKFNEKKIRTAVKNTLNNTQPEDMTNFLNICRNGVVISKKWAFTNPQFKPIEQLDGVNSAVTEGFVTGLLKIDGGKVKPKQVVHKHQLLFSITKGRAEVKVQDKCAVFNEFDMFIVPAGCEYYIKNLNDDQELYMHFSKYPKDL